MAAEWAFAGTFIGFCLLSARQLYRKGRDILCQYRQSVADQFQEAESLLKEAQNLLDQAKQKKESLNLRIKEILDLAQSEATFVLEKRHQDIQEAQANYEHFFHQQSCVITRQWKKQAVIDLWEGITEYLEHSLDLKDPSQDIAVLLRGVQPVPNTQAPSVPS